MTADECRQDIKDCIAFYEARGSCWVSAVTYIGICYLWGGSWMDLERCFRPYRR